MEKILKYSIFAIIGLFAVALIVQLISAFINPAYYGYGYGGMMGYGYGGMMGYGYGGMMGFGMLGGVIFLIIFVVIIAALFEQTGTRTQVDSLELLNKRYASGAITREEYLEKKKDLE